MVSRSELDQIVKPLEALIRLCVSLVIFTMISAVILLHILAKKQRIDNHRPVTKLADCPNDENSNDNTFPATPKSDQAGPTLTMTTN